MEHPSHLGSCPVIKKTNLCYINACFPAAALITSHEYTLIEISDLLGYSSYRYFAQVYKKYQHCLPAQTAAMACSAASSSREAEK